VETSRLENAGCGGRQRGGGGINNGLETPRRARHACRLVDEVVWVKMTVNRRMAKSHGYYLQHAKEVCLVGQRGEDPPGTRRGGVCSDVIFSERRSAPGGMGGGEGGHRGPAASQSKPKPCLPEAAAKPSGLNLGTGVREAR
jgi:hypothetical protein